MIGIYKITSPTNKVYIGQSWNLSARENSYRGLFCENQQKLYRSLTKHGWPAHTFEILLELRSGIDQSWLDYWEQFFMDYYRDEGCELMNLREAGNGGKHSEDSKRKMSNSRRGRALSETTKQKMSRTRQRINLYNIKTVLQYDKELNFLREWRSVHEAARESNADFRKISDVALGKRKSTGGFVWKYKEIIK